MIDISGIDKAKLLAALYNNSKPLGLGFRHFDPKLMTDDEAAKLLEDQAYFDYLKGRVMKVNLAGDELDPWGYDRDNGQGSLQKIVDGLND